MTSFYDFTVAPLRGILGPVYDAYRKAYDYTFKTTIEGWQVGTIQGNPLPDMVEDRINKWYYSVYGPVDMPVNAGTVGIQKEILMQTKPIDYETMDTGIGRFRREVKWVPDSATMQEIFVDMPYALKTDYKCSTVSTKHN
jgi:hypothetical protein